MKTKFKQERELERKVGRGGEQMGGSYIIATICGKAALNVI